MRLLCQKMNVVNWKIKVFLSLRKAAKNLRISMDSGEGGELAEILLCGVMKHHYKELLVVFKIYHKKMLSG